MSTPDTPLLEVTNLSIDFGSQTAVDNISFTLHPGQTLGLVGESGSGKSATSLAILRLLPPSARITGSITFAGQPLLTLPEPAMCRHRGSSIAMVFQEPMTALNPAMPIGRQISEAVAAHHPELDRHALKSRALAAMDEVALPDPLARFGHYPHQFSGGQRQRILIAMAIVNRPQLLIADEPTTALDVTVQAQILELLQGLRHSHKLAMLFISHDLAVVAQACNQPGDQIAVMRQGQIVELSPARSPANAPTAGLFRNPQHPYTRRLLASAPTMHSDRTQPLASLADSTQP